MNRLLDFFRLKPVKAIIVRVIVPLGDAIFAPLTVMAALLLKLIRRVGVYRMRISKAVFEAVGVFPIRDHYYEPLFNPRRLRRSLREDRDLPGIDLNVEGQLELLARFRFGEELKRFPREKRSELEYHYDNDNFGPGDAEYLYSLMRLYKPATVIEIGSGFSTLMARNAIVANRAEDPRYRCRHACIEPYEMAWLEKLEGTEILRRPVEEVDRKVFADLGRNDILFIDSSHVIRPQGDVVVEVLEILPLLGPGVLVHVHDIFTPRDYPDEWVIDQVRLYNEQYLVEAFLSFNTRFRIIAALNYLKYHHPEELLEKCPMLAESMHGLEPGSLWMIRT
jgi:hypothetical protein